MKVQNEKQKSGFYLLLQTGPLTLKHLIADHKASRDDYSKSVCQTKEVFQIH